MSTSTAIVPTNINVPAHLQNRLSQPSVLGTAITGGIGGGADYPRLSIKGARFRIIEGGAETLLPQIELDTIIVGANPRLSKTYYDKDWNADTETNAAPDCYSLDGIRPVPEASMKQSDICASCPKNAWGSKVKEGKEMKACSDQKRLAVVAADDPGGSIYLLQVTPAALKGLNSYHKELSHRGIPAEVVKTRISFDASASFPKLQFAFAGFNDEASQAEADKLFGSAKVLEVTGEGNAVQDVAALAAPAAPKPAPVVVSPPPPPPPPPEPPAAPVRGFGKSAGATTAPATPKAAPKAPKAAPAVTEASSANLQKEIADLVNSLDADDGE